MRIPCDCGNDTFHLVFAPPLRVAAECTECSERREIGGEQYADEFPGEGAEP